MIRWVRAFGWVLLIAIVAFSVVARLKRKSQTKVRIPAPTQEQLDLIEKYSKRSETRRAEPQSKQEPESKQQPTGK